MAPASYVCADCKQKFPLHAILQKGRDSICLSCDLRSEIQNQLEKEKRYRERLEVRVAELERQVRALTESRQSVIGVATKKSLPQAAVSSEHGSSVSGLTVSAGSGAATDNPFVPVRRGARPLAPKIECLPIKTTNRFTVLGFEDTNENDVRLVGDSIVRGQLEEFCGRNPNSRQRYCFPGAKVQDITNAVDYITEGCTKDTTVLIHVGTNEVMFTRSEELLQKYKVLMQKMKEKTNNIILTGILPRLRHQNKFFSKASYINNSLKSICIEENIYYSNYWDDFYGKEDLFLRDGLHLNAVGAARLGRLLHNSLFSFQNAKKKMISK